MNAENLVPNSERTPTEREENARKAGTASGKARRRKKAVRKILEEYLALPVSSNDRLHKMAEKSGLDDEAQVKELYVALCVINTLRDGRVDDISRLIEILGENEEKKKVDKRTDDALTAALIEEAKQLDADQ
jgi:hypothetical protein